MSSSAPGASGRMLLHACCGPCSLEPTRIFADEGVELSVLYYNPNIHPAEEHARRLGALAEHVCGPQGLELVKGAYDSERWEEEVGVHGTDREARCRACYRMRFEQCARTAKERGFDAISTTLTISPYQLTSIILEELEAAAERHGLRADARDFRDRYREATRLSRAKGMYRQNYCGCRFSVAEAAAEREAARKRHEERKRLKHVALVRTAAEGVCTQRNQV